MNNVENNPRSSFFPEKKKGVGRGPSRLKESLLENNDPSRKQELEQIAKKDAKVTIPDSIKDYARIKRAVDTAPAIDNTEKIARLREQIKAGDYKVDYDALADKILESEF